MFKRFSVVFTLLFSSVLFGSSPALANTEACVNEVLKQPTWARYGFDFASQVAEVEHEGTTYHWINLSDSKLKQRKAFISSVFATNSEGLCKLVTIDITGPLPTIQDYYTVLGKEVTDKFVQAFRNQ